MQNVLHFRCALLFVLLCALHMPAGYCQKKQQANELFNDKPLHLSLTGNLKALFNDRGDNSSYHPLLLQYFNDDNNLIAVNSMAKTRGHFRRLLENCKMPPLLLTFEKNKKQNNSLFSNQTKLKLVVPCRGDEYVIDEWLVYKLYNIITDKSFRAKLVEIDFIDSAMKKKTETHYCILLEDEKKVAAANHCYVWKKKMVEMKNTNADDFKTMAVFQYMIGNTDWSVPYLQNMVLIAKDSARPATPVPYDFDHAGIVDAPYAAPAPELEIANIRVRLYRGYCESDSKNFNKTFELFNKLKDTIYNLYNNCALLKPRYKRFVTNFLDDFYKTINSPRRVEAAFLYPCTTNVRIELKGLKD